MTSAAPSGPTPQPSSGPATAPGPDAASASASGPAPAGSFPLFAVVHLTTVFAVLLGGLDTRRLLELLQASEAAIWIGLGSVLFGAILGGCFGLTRQHRLRAVALAVPIGALASLLAVCLIGSGQPVRLLIAAAAVLISPTLIQARHA